jgi:uncharacterized membrane protein YkoI
MGNTGRWIVGGALTVALAGGGIGIAQAAGGDDSRNDSGNDSDAPITGEALGKASAAALRHTGGGRVTETEVGDEDGYYEVEVTLDGGRQVDVHLDRDFNVLGSKADHDGPGDDGSR